MPEINMFHFKVMGWGFCLKVLKQVKHKRVKKNKKTKTPAIYIIFEVAGCFHESSWQYMFKVFTGAKKKKNMYIQYVPKCFALWQIFFFCKMCYSFYTRENCEPRYENFCHERRRRVILKCCPFLHSKRALLSRRSHFIWVMVRHCFSVDFRCHETLVDVDENGLSCGFKLAAHQPNHLIWYSPYSFFFFLFFSFSRDYE